MTTTFYLPIHQIFIECLDAVLATGSTDGHILICQGVQSSD